jgi:hypothetical protein
MGSRAGCSTKALIRVRAVPECAFSYMQRCRARAILFLGLKQKAAKRWHGHDSASGHAGAWVEVPIGTAACAGFVAFTFVVDHHAPVVEGQPAPEWLFHGRSVSAAAISFCGAVTFPRMPGNGSSRDREERSLAQRLVLLTGQENSAPRGVRRRRSSAEEERARMAGASCPCTCAPRAYWGRMCGCALRMCLKKSAKKFWAPDVLKEERDRAA